MIVDDLRRLLDALNAEAVDYVLIGGAAMNAHGIIRATEDIDLMVDPSEENIARLRAALRRTWDDDCIDEIRSEDLAGDYPAVRYGPPEGDVYVDIVARFGTAFSFADIEASAVDVADVKGCVATPAALYAMKKDTVRPIDQADALALKARFGLPDED